MLFVPFTCNDAKTESKQFFNELLTPFIQKITSLWHIRWFALLFSFISFNFISFSCFVQDCLHRQDTFHLFSCFFTKCSTTHNLQSTLSCDDNFWLHSTLHAHSDYNTTSFLHTKVPKKSVREKIKFLCTFHSET